MLYDRIVRAALLSDTTLDYPMEVEVETILKNEKYYPDNIKKRVKKIVMEQRRKYDYLF